MPTSVPPSAINASTWHQPGEALVLEADHSADDLGIERRAAGDDA